MSTFSVVCLASNVSASFSVTAAPTLEFDNKFRDLISLHVGATLKIPVKVSGIPTPRITWAREDGQMRSGGRITISVQEDSTTLTVKKVTKEEDGLITLTADNEVGEAKAKFDVEVLGEFWVSCPSVPFILVFTFSPVCLFFICLSICLYTCPSVCISVLFRSYIGCLIL